MLKRTLYDEIPSLAMLFVFFCSLWQGIPLPCDDHVSVVRPLLVFPKPQCCVHPSPARSLFGRLPLLQLDAVARCYTAMGNLPLTLLRVL